MRPLTQSSHDVVIVIKKLRTRAAQLQEFAAAASEQDAPRVLVSAHYRAADDIGIIVATVTGSRLAWELSWLVVHATGEGFSAMTERMMPPDRWQWFVQERLLTFDQVGARKQSMTVALSRLVWAASLYGRRRRMGRRRTSDDAPTCSGILFDDTRLRRSPSRAGQTATTRVTCACSAGSPSRRGSSLPSSR